MDKTSILLAKVAALQKNFSKIIWDRLQRIGGSIVEPLMSQYSKYCKELIESIPELYADLEIMPIPEPFCVVPTMRDNADNEQENVYTHRQLEPIIQSIDYILEVRANYRIGEKQESEDRPKRVFISHGRSAEWYKVQSHMEKDINFGTLELTQEANFGRTVLQKLNDESNRCGYAVIVMTGDDIIEDEIRARENVLHEIGFFQGKYGLQNVVLLHEEGVNIPSNIHGLVYIPFPKNTVEATFGALDRELRALIQ